MGADLDLTNLQQEAHAMQMVRKASDKSGGNCIIPHQSPIVQIMASGQSKLTWALRGSGVFYIRGAKGEYQGLWPLQQPHLAVRSAAAPYNSK